MSRKAMLADKPLLKQKIEKLRAILNAEDKILDIKIWAANEMLNMGEEGQKVAVPSHIILTKNLKIN